MAFLVRLLFWLPADAGGGWRGLRGTATGKCCGDAIAIAIAIAGVTAAASCQRCSKLQRKGRAMDGCSGRGAKLPLQMHKVAKMHKGQRGRRGERKTASL